ncbi:metal-dependent hydrolase family protein [Prauserella cavernicola]|uniref:Amidohydrolase family protein n=1 Tax=Prauserella cavernicola TaxID=2800127 RepID=A0A934QW78_9PSEU|nr:amidohydrolase family protein [Prauserella cavernicola]MBK1787531.1 amidohydrolase family protein [Prauserella cavernicola]
MGDRRSWLLRDADVLDVLTGEVATGQRILVVGGTIREIGGADVGFAGAETIDLGGLTVMPGMIDGHVHVTAPTHDLASMRTLSPSYTAIYAANQLRAMLGRGFTTVRDCGGADHGLARALDDGMIVGSRLYYGGKAISQTGGHGDMRAAGEHVRDDSYCCPDWGRVCDGVPEMRRAVRDEIRKGAHHVKLMLSGGVASPTDRVDSTQFALDEIRAAVEETTAANRYVAGHAYTAEAVRRGLVNGVRTIEHGNFIDEQTAALFPEHGAFLVPTLTNLRAVAKRGTEIGSAPETMAKVSTALEAGLSGLEVAYRAGVDIVYGTDLCGLPLQELQPQELLARAEVQKPIDVIRSCTSVAARMLGEEGRLGIVAPGAHADLLAVRGNPVDDLHRLTRGEHLGLIMRGGALIRDPH